MTYNRAEDRKERVREVTEGLDIDFSDGCFVLLPGGNEDEFPGIDEGLVRLAVEAYTWDCGTVGEVDGGRLWFIPMSEVSKLPVDDDPYDQDEMSYWAGGPEPYLPFGDDDGHRLLSPTEYPWLWLGLATGIWKKLS